MDKTLIEEAKKHRVSTQKLATVYLPADERGNNSAKKWLETIQKFLTEHNLKDAKIEIRIEGHDGYLENIVIQETVERTE